MRKEEEYRSPELQCTGAASLQELEKRSWNLVPDGTWSRMLRCVRKEASGDQSKHRLIGGMRWGQEEASLLIAEKQYWLKKCKVRKLRQYV